MKVLFLASGGGSTAKKLYHLSKYSDDIFFRNTEIEIISDRYCGAIKWSEENKIPSLKIESKNFEHHAINWIKKRKPDIVVTTIYKILSKDFIDASPCKLINLHYSLLPSFNGGIGENVIDKAIAYGSNIFGATCHNVIELVDLGKPLSQAAFISSKLDRNYILDLCFRCGCIALFSALKKIKNKRELNIKSGNLRLIDELIIYSGEDKQISKLKDNFWTTT